MLILESFKAEQQAPNDAEVWKLYVLSKDLGEPRVQMALRVRVGWSQVTVGGISPMCAQGLRDKDAGDQGCRRWGGPAQLHSVFLLLCYCASHPQVDSGDGFDCCLVIFLVITNKEAWTEPGFT